MNPDALFRALADETRLRCLALIVQKGELCVCELTHALGETQPKISRHLAILRGSGILLDRREGLWVYYRLHPELPVWAREVLRITVTELTARAPYATELAALKAMPNRPGTRFCT